MGCSASSVALPVPHDENVVDERPLFNTELRLAQAQRIQVAGEGSSTLSSTGQSLTRLFALAGSTPITIDMQQALKAVGQVIVDHEVVSQRKMALQGMFLQGKLGCWAVPSHELSTFVSSTFTDTQHEREVLVNIVLPELRRQARPYQVLVCLLDMRFGVTDEATVMHETWDECREQLEHSFRKSQGIFFLSLQSCKYGYEPLPRILPNPRNEENHGNGSQVQYKRDDNDGKGSLVLQSMKLTTDHPAWKVLSKLDSPKHENEAFLPLDDVEAGRVALNSYKLQDAEWAPSELPIGKWLEGSTIEGSITDEFPWDKVEACADWVKFDRFIRLPEDTAKKLLTNLLAPEHNNTMINDSNARDLAYGKRVRVDWSVEEGDTQEKQRSKVEASIEKCAKIVQNILGGEIAKTCFLRVAMHKDAKWFRRVRVPSAPLALDISALIGSNDPYWKKFERVRDSLPNDLCSFHPHTDDSETPLRVGHSVTEWESYHAIHLAGSQSERLAWLHRELEDRTTADDGQFLNKGLFWDLDRDKKVDQDAKCLREKQITMMKKLIPKNNQFSYNVEWPWGANAKPDHIGSEWHQDAVKLFSGELARIIAAKQQWDKDACGLNMPGLDAAEFLHHATWARRKVDHFFGREAMVKDVKSALMEGPPQLVAVFGGSGCGKTALLSMVASQVCAKSQNVVIRFCGTTANTDTALGLCNTLTKHLHWLQKGAMPDSQASNYQDAVKQWSEALGSTVTVIDSLDQLTNADQARTELSFLEPVLEKRVLVSCIPDAKQVNGQRNMDYYFGCETKLRAWEAEEKVQCIQLSKMSFGEEWFEQRLKQTGRRLTKEQLEYVVAQTCDPTSFSEGQQSPSILYCQLAARAAAGWHSWTPPQHALPAVVPGVQPMLDALLDHTERRFGRELTSTALTAMTFAVNGLSATEMEDVLSMDESVLDAVFQYHTPTVRRLPSHVWARVQRQLDDLLVDQGHTTRWYHRQLWECAEKRYAVLKPRVSKLMGIYFANIVDPALRKERHIADQPYVLSDQPGTKFFDVDVSQLNRRRCAESLRHLVNAEMWDETAAEATQDKEQGPLAGIACRAYLGYTFSMLRSLATLVDQLHSHTKTSTADQGQQGWQNSGEPTLTEYAHDAYRLLLGSATDIHLHDQMDRLLHHVWTKLPESSAWKNVIARSSRPDYSLRRIISRIPETWPAERSVITGHKGGVNSVAVWPTIHAPCDQNSSVGHYRSPITDSGGKQIKLIATGSDDYSIRIWDAETGECMQTLQGHSGGVWSVVYSSDGKRIVSGSGDESIRIWDAETGECMHTLHGHLRYVTSVGYSPDGKSIVSGSDDQSIRIWDAETGECKCTLQGHSSNVRSVCYSPDGKRIVSGSNDESIRIWDEETGECKRTLECHSGCVTSVSYSPDGKRIVSGSDDEIVRIWNAKTGKCIHTLQGHSSTVMSVGYSPDGKRIVSGAFDNSMRVWNAETGECIHELKGHSDGVMSVRYSPDGQRIVSGSGDYSVRIWDAGTGDCKHTENGHTETVWSVRYCPDGKRIVSGSSDKSVRVFDAETGQCMHKLQLHSSEIATVGYSPDGKRIVSGSDDKCIRIWNAETGECLQTLQGHSQTVTSVGYSPNGKCIVSGSEDQSIQVWDADTGECKHTLQGHPGGVTSVIYSPDGKHILSGSYDHNIRIWDAEAGECMHTLQGHLSYVTSVCYSPDGKRIVSGSFDDSVRVWNAETGECMQILQGHSGNVMSVSYSPDGKHIVSGSDDESIWIWDAETGECKHTLQGHSGSVTSVSYSPDGKHIVSGSYDRITRIWDAETG